ncbi:hypothetical protein HRI_005048800 [Hibiscus trionum]|uniref:Uncharacterized protein n=1 Tax=Hibiscus trionum TaxID=183268 RepID=A0A9W7MX76_HIBTR|nr:hypothetical protein HRI_005048800 [Hibiscus trionum]
MTGNNKSDGKVLKKKHQRLSPKKLDLKEKKEEVKLMGMLVAETRAVQAELTQKMEDSLLNGEDPRTTGQQLGQVNIMCGRLNATAGDYILGLLDALDQADRDKGH